MQGEDVTNTFRHSACRSMKQGEGGRCSTVLFPVLAGLRRRGCKGPSASGEYLDGGELREDKLQDIADAVCGRNGS